MSDPIAPESRIFRIGRECYVVYLGKERDDVRPFLRIGNTRDIPDEVHRVISTTVITDDHVGNPLLEILNVPKCQGLYLGDTDVVGIMKRFLKSFDLPTDEVTDYRKVKDGEKRHMVWFYSSGNIHLRYDDQVIFDLHKRERDDGHFVRLYERAKAEFLRNPLRYIKQDFVGQGLILDEGNGFWFEGGELLSLAAHPGFVATLMADGIDPDFISTSAYDLTRDDMDSHEAAVFIGFVKRMRQRKKQLKVFSSDPELLRKLRLLFPARGDVPVTLDVADVSGRKKAMFRESIISRKNEAWMLHRAGMPEIIFGGTTANGVSVDIAGGTVSVSGEGGTTVLSPPRGFPVDFLGHSVPENQLVEKYLSFINGHLKVHLKEDEAQAAAVVEKTLKMIKDDMTAGKKSVSPLLKQTVQQARDAVRHCEPEPGGSSWFLFANARSIAGIFVESAGEDHALARPAEQMEELIDGLLKKAGEPDSILPFWGDLYLEGKSCLLWRVTKRGFVPADVNATREINDRIRDIASLNEAPWKRDEERLLALIRSLDEGGEGPLSDEQLALLAKPEEEKKVEEGRKGGDGAEGRDASSSATRAEHTASAEVPHAGSAAVTGGKRGAASARKGGRSWLWILLILLLLLIGGAVVWDLSGTAPWGRLLGGRVEVAKEIRKDSQDPGRVGPNTGTAGETGQEAAADTAADTAGDAGEAVAGDVAMSEDGGAAGAAEAGASAVKVDPDKPPRTQEDVAVYLNVDGVFISEADIHLAANEIAVLNGFKDLDYRVFTGADPDWIYPGNILMMPSGEAYEIRRGDTIWFLAARRVRLAVMEDKAAFDEAAAVLDDPTSGEEDRRGAAAVLERISVESKAAAMRRMASEKLP